MNYIGNSNSMTVHAEDCEFVLQIHPANFEQFAEVFDALGQEYKPCGLCMNPSEARLQFQQHREVLREIKARSACSCQICGETRGVQRAHITPRANGGVVTMPLCPSCHWNYDHGLLRQDELNRLYDIARPNNRQRDILMLQRNHGAVSRLMRANGTRP